MNYSFALFVSFFSAFVFLLATGQKQLEWCLLEDAGLFDVACTNGTELRGPFPAGTKLKYKYPIEPIESCSGKWLPVYEQEKVFYTDKYGDCSLVESGSAGDGDNLPIAGIIGGAILAGVLIIIIPLIILIVCLRRKAKNSHSSIPEEGTHLVARSRSATGTRRRMTQSGSNNNVVNSGNNGGTPGQMDSGVPLAPIPPAGPGYPSTIASDDTVLIAGTMTQSVGGIGGAAPGRPLIPKNAMVPGAGNMYQTFSPDQISPNAPEALYWGTDALIPYNLLKMGEEIGRGGYGKVYRGIYQGMVVAIKAMTEGLDEKEAKDFRAEAKLLAKIPPHPNVVKFVGLSLKNTKILVVMEFLGGSLIHKVQDQTFRFDRSIVLKLLKDVARGMIHLAQHNIIHRDLAARNIMLDLDLTGKVTDFGMSRTVTHSAHVTKSAVGPLKWMSPESLLDKLWSEKTDVWAYGVMTFEILAREDPYQDLEPVQVAAQVCRDNISLEPPLDMGSDIVALMHECMQYEPQHRPDFRQILGRLETMR